MDEIGDLDLLQEIYEEEAICRTAEIHDDIKITLQLPMVYMIYRRLAINEEALDGCSEITKPVILTGAIDRAGEQIANILTACCIVVVRSNIRADGGRWSH